MIGNCMYLRPGNLFKDFAVEESVNKVDTKGRVVEQYDTSKGIVIHGCLASARTNEIARFDALGHPVTHSIVQYGYRRAKENDRLHMSDGRTFLIKGIDEAGSLGVATIYYVEERKDVK